jgi:protein phosphatase
MDWIFQLDEHSEATFEADLREALHHSQQTLQNEADAIPQRRGMATTLTMAYVDWPKFYVVHVGDTRCYHITSGEIRSLTTDHTIAELVRTSQRLEEAICGKPISEEDTKPFSNQMNHTLYNVIGGTYNALDPQVSRSELGVGDSLLLCSDGLTRYLSDDEIKAAVEKENCTAAEICAHLVEEANRRGGKDNITVVLAKFNEESTGEQACADAEVGTPVETFKDSGPQDGDSPSDLASKSPTVNPSEMN